MVRHALHASAQVSIRLPRQQAPRCCRNSQILAVEAVWGVCFLHRQALPAEQGEFMSSYQLRSDSLLKAASARGDRSCYAISKRTGIAESTLSRLRRGVARPATETLLILAAAYGLSIDDLIDQGADDQSEEGAA
ncbi:XRE family transcriptional regulator [Streptomyces spectabilis]|uniref:XRE family transcriptional regulator n=2 Tax=Streptomyces spectabilis TaxID=68270 RepID=A0A5P2XQ64_STRST|nr:XRE family transcriptional regulator [Streptomyces spectabilis]